MYFNLKYMPTFSKMVIGGWILLFLLVVFEFYV